MGRGTESLGKVELLRLGDSEKLRRWPREPVRNNTSGGCRKTLGMFSES